MEPTEVLIPIVLIILCICMIYFYVQTLISYFRSPLRYIPEPETSDTLSSIINKSTIGDVHKFFEKYGKVMKWKIAHTHAIVTSDTKAVGHILARSYDYQRLDLWSMRIAELLGSGIYTAEGNQHKKQRQIMNPVFGSSTIKALTPVFYKKAYELRNIWTAKVQRSKSVRTIEVLSWMSRVSLDILGIAGFGYSFNALQKDKNNEFSKAITFLIQSMKIGNKMSAITCLLRYKIPILRKIFPLSPEIKQAKETVERIENTILQERMNKERGFRKNPDNAFNDLRGRDLLSVLVRSNMETTNPDSQRLSDDEIRAQIPTILLAGHGQISKQMMWCLYALAMYPEIQQRLRTELLGVSSEEPDMNDLDSLPFLDAFAVHDDIIPLEEPFVNTRGVNTRELRITKGQLVIIPKMVLNTDKTIWGPDAHDFNPDRWLNLPDTVKKIPGAWSHIMTFYGGTKSCIGYRFAVIEIKTLLFVLCRCFEFSPSNSTDSGERQFLGVSRRFVEESGTRLSLNVKVYSAAAG